MQEEIQKMIDECFLDCGFGGSYKAKARLKNDLLAFIKKHERGIYKKGFDDAQEGNVFGAKLKEVEK